MGLPRGHQIGNRCTLKRPESGPDRRSKPRAHDAQRRGLVLPRPNQTTRVREHGGARTGQAVSSGALRWLACSAAIADQHMAAAAVAVAKVLPQQAAVHTLVPRDVRVPAALCQTRGRRQVGGTRCAGDICTGTGGVVAAAAAAATGHRAHLATPGRAGDVGVAASVRQIATASASGVVVAWPRSAHAVAEVFSSGDPALHLKRGGPTSGLNAVGRPRCAARPGGTRATHGGRSGAQGDRLLERGVGGGESV